MKYLALLMMTLLITLSACSTVQTVNLDEPYRDLAFCSDANTTVTATTDTITSVKDYSGRDYKIELSNAGTSLKVVPKVKRVAEKSMSNPNALFATLSSGKIVWLIEKDCNGQDLNQVYD